MMPRNSRLKARPNDFYQLETSSLASPPITTNAALLPNHLRAALESLAEDRRLAAYVDEYKSIVATNGGHIIVKCAFQMISKSRQVGGKVGRHCISIN